jgi:hypothetical protein
MNRKLPRSPCSVGLAALIVLASCLGAPAQSLPATQADSSSAAFKKTMESRLDEERARIRKIAEPVLERFRKMRGPDLETNIENQTIKTQGAEAAYQNAKLTREVSEIAVKEYEEGIYLVDQARAEGEARLAESDIKRSMDNIVESSALLERIKKISSGSMQDTLAVVQFESIVKVAQLSKRKAELELEQARSKLNLLREYEKPRRLRELKAEAEKVFADQLAKQMTAQLEKDRLARMKKEAEGIKPPAKYQPILALLADAASLDGEIRGKLAKLEPKDDAPQAGSRKEIEELGRSLEAKVNEAGHLFEDLKFSELATDIIFASTRPASGAALFSPENSRSIFQMFQKVSPEDRVKLKTATEEERTRILKKAGFTDAEIQEMQYTRERIQRGETGP